MQTNNNNDNDKTYEVGERLAAIEAIVSRLEHKLLGNGQPGEIEKINSRLGLLEKLEAKGRGALWVIGAIITVITSGGLIHVFKIGLR